MEPARREQSVRSNVSVNRAAIHDRFDVRAEPALF
jgi:hypothetical protein